MDPEKRWKQEFYPVAMIIVLLALSPFWWMAMDWLLTLTRGN